jgi:hypothetical protein
MPTPFREAFLIAIAVALSGCGLAVPDIAEPYDRIFDKDATLHMEQQIKRAIYCELKEAVHAVRGLENPEYLHYGQRETTNVDSRLPDFWGAQVTLTFTVQEASKFAPGISLKTPMHDAPVNFIGQVIGASAPLSAITYGARKISQDYAFGLGGELSAEANRIDTYNYYYTIHHLNKPYPPTLDVCDPEYAKQLVGPKSYSSLFTVQSNLGIKEWVQQAWEMTDFLRSSRVGNKITGLPIAYDNAKSDVMSYDIKFKVVSSGNVTPSWDLVRVATTGNPLFTTSRERTHELLITIGPGKAPPAVTRLGRPALVTAEPSGPSSAAQEIHNARLIGSAVAAALQRGQ